jgi:CMP-N-acetylneuraminic acid synthetase
MDNSYNFIAVIPARAGSKGIPNKNIRILNGKPLISYCIENALRCEAISDIIVSTDSEEVNLIANYYGVRCLKRRAELCADDVTLDAVIYDACKDIDCDYVITMQPTSPTLDYRTLDKAIEYAIKNDLDTLISAVNKPHLAWTEKDGHIVPAYSERLNRQYLPKRYEETGAFVISKKSVVKSNTRIGEKVAVFEISENEAIDIDSFQDMIAAESILKEQKIAIVVDGNNSIGLGHVGRMLELADMFYTKPVFFYDTNKTEINVFGETTYSLVPYSSKDELFNKLNENDFTVLINDILDTEENYIKKLKSFGLKVVNFEDIGTGADYADIVINALYDEEQVHRYIGPNYYLIPKMFLLYKPIVVKRDVEKVLVCFGGADPQNYTEVVLEEIKKDEYQKYNFVIVLGRAKKNYQALLEFESSNIKLMYDIRNMPEVMSQCDIAITSQGRTCFELASLGIPTLSLAQNEREEKHSFVSDSNGFIRKGILSKHEIIKALHYFLKLSLDERKEMHKKMLKTDLLHGRDRIKSLIDSL